MNNLVAIIVTFNPDTEVLNALLKALESQVAYIVVVDNGSPAETINIIRRTMSVNSTLIQK